MHISFLLFKLKAREKVENEVAGSLEEEEEGKEEKKLM